MHASIITLSSVLARHSIISNFRVAKCSALFRRVKDKQTKNWLGRLDSTDRSCSIGLLEAGWLMVGAASPVLQRSSAVALLSSVLIGI